MEIEGTIEEIVERYQTAKFAWEEARDDQAAEISETYDGAGGDYELRALASSWARKKHPETYEEFKAATMMYEGYIASLRVHEVRALVDQAQKMPSWGQGEIVQ